MPKTGISTDWIEDRENEIAILITAKDLHLAGLRALATALQQRGFITEDYHTDILDSIDSIAAALLVGKKNTARLRNYPPE